MTEHIADPTASPSERILRQRLGAVAELLTPARGSHLEPTSPAISVLDDLVAHFQRDRVDLAEAWLLLTALAGAMPLPGDVVDAGRTLALERGWAVSISLLENAATLSRQRGTADIELKIVTGGYLVDVDQTANTDRHTGIQRVVRETVSRWAARREVTLVGWTSSGGGFRFLTSAEIDRVVAWDDTRAYLHARERSGPTHLVVPWKSTLLLPDVPTPHKCLALAALAEYSGNSVAMLGYDAIPVLSADLRPPQEPDLYTKYLTVVKHARRVAGISLAAASEFAGFASALSSQGLTGPSVSAVPLPVTPVAKSAVARGSHRTPSSLPLVLCVASQEVHKNHVAVLHAAELLWRRGLRFRLEFIGRHGWDMRDFDGRITDLQRHRRPVAVRRGVRDDELQIAYLEARFSVFPSLHEGYGLPVAESLAAGTPVITSNFGSMSEIALGGGCLLIDPRDDQAIAGAMERMLTDDELVARLAKEARSRQFRTWDEYADELWEALTAPGGRP